jgi:hypothetical protein
VRRGFSSWGLVAFVSLIEQPAKRTASERAVRILRAERIVRFMSITSKDSEAAIVPQFGAFFKVELLTLFHDGSKIPMKDRG